MMALMKSVTDKQPAGLIQSPSEGKKRSPFWPIGWFGVTGPAHLRGASGWKIPTAVQNRPP